MKASQYNIFVEQSETGETILYNSLYGSLSLWEPSEIGAVKHVLANVAKSESEYAVTMATLIDQKNIIEDSVDEIAIIKKRKSMGIKDGNRLDVIIMPTLDCNFACVYCYENHRPGVMSEPMETAIKKWLAVQIPKYKVVMLHWFGGEPLMGFQRIISITRFAADMAAKSGSSLVTHMTTNGYLLNKKRIRELIDAGIHDYQITVDGTPDIHDRMRMLKNGKGTFDRLFHNINNLARADRRLKISLRVNFNHDNLHTIPRLLEMFPDDVRAQLRIVYEPIFGSCSLSATDNLPAIEISEAMVDYYKLAERLGYDVVLGQAGIYTGRLVYCYAERENQFIINCNGDVYKCSVGEFNPEQRVGYIRGDGVFVKEAERWNQWTGEAELFEDECFSCKYLPLCMGGCRNMRLHRKGTGSYCSLVPTNTSYLLKQVAYGNFESFLSRESENRV